MAGCATSQTGYVQHNVANAACLLPKHQCNATPWSTHTRDSRYLFLYIYATKYNNVNHPVLQWAGLGLG